MKVIIGGPFPYKNQNIWGGVESVIQNVNNGFELFEKKFSINVFSGSFEAKNDYEKTLNITYIRQPKFKIGSIFISKYPYLIKKILKKTDFDILNAHSIDFGYYGLNYRDNMLFTLHGITWEEKKFLSYSGQIGWHYFYVKRLNHILKRIKYLVSINPYSRNLVEKKTNAQIFDICNPVPNHYFNIENKNSENRILYLGNISKRKNLYSLIKSLNYVKKEVKNFKLIVAGKMGDINYFNMIKKYISKYNLNKNIEFIGKISEKRKLEEFSKMSFLLLPSLQETAPMVISESFASGKPVVASNICGIPYMLDDEKNGLLINPNDEKIIAEKIIYLFNNKQEIMEKGKSAKSYAKNYYSLKKVIKKYSAAYEEIYGNL